MTLATLVPAILLGIRLAGLPGVAYAHLAVILLVNFPIYSVVVGRLTGTRIRSMLHALAIPLIAAGLATVVAKTATTQMHSPYWILATALILGAIVYTGLVGPQFGELLPARVAGNKFVRSVVSWPKSLAAKVQRAKN